MSQQRAPCCTRRLCPASIGLAPAVRHGTRQARVQFCNAVSVGRLRRGWGCGGAGLAPSVTRARHGFDSRAVHREDNSSVGYVELPRLARSSALLDIVGGVPRVTRFAKRPAAGAQAGRPRSGSTHSTWRAGEHLAACSPAPFKVGTRAGDRTSAMKAPARFTATSSQTAAAVCLQSVPSFPTADLGSQRARTTVQRAR